jgi:hypothetical protein
LSFTTPRSVISGKPYLVRSVHDRVPAHLDDFLGQTSFVLDLDGEDYAVHGPGIDADPGVRVYEKSDEGFGKDIRAWLVCPVSDGDGFTAMHIGVDVPPQAVQGALS